MSEKEVNPYKAITDHLKLRFDESVRKVNDSLSKVIDTMGYLKTQAELIHQYSGDTTALKLYNMATKVMKESINKLPTIPTIDDEAQA